MTKKGYSLNPLYRMGDLDPWMDETFLKQLWLSYGENVIVKLIRDKRTRCTYTHTMLVYHQLILFFYSISCGYAFIGFSSTLSAQKALTTIHGTRIPNSLKTFRLNWASGGGICDRKYAECDYTLHNQILIVQK